MNYDFSPNYNLLILVHLAINAWVFCICIKRMHLMQDVLLRVKAQYVVMLVLSVANGLSPLLFRQWPTVISVLYAGGVLYMLRSDQYQWHNGPPKEAVTAPAALGDH